MLIVHFNLKPGEDDYSVIENFTVCGTCADDDNTVVTALINELAEMGSDDACVVAYERMDGYSPNIEDYEGCSSAHLMCTYDKGRDRHNWWCDEEINEEFQLW